MRTFIRGLALAVLTVTVIGCGSGKSTKATTQPHSSPSHAETSEVCGMQYGGRGVLQVTVPAQTSCDGKDGMLRLEGHDHEAMNIWLVRGARDPSEGVSRVGQEIASEFKGFKSTSTTPLMVAGAPATRMMGTGTEADDGDPGTADVIVFKAGEYVFVACTHGEYLPPSAQQWMLSVVQSARVPAQP